MSNYNSCVSELAPRLKKRGLENAEVTAASMCAMRFPDDKESSRKFSVESNTNEKRRAFALELSIAPEAYPEQFNN